MSTLFAKPFSRLALFAALLAAVFAASAVAGEALHPQADRGSAPREAQVTAKVPERAAGHGHASATAAVDAAGPADAAPAPAVKGLAITDRGYTLELVGREATAGARTWLRFRILRRDGSPLQRYAVEHERRMHLIVVRRDGSGFQHLHPRLGPDGTWTTRIRFAEPGSYRVFADFKTGDTAVTLGADLAVDGAARYRPLPKQRDVATTASGHRVRLEAGRTRAGRTAILRFTVTRDGRTLHTEPYLGAGGHLVALRAGDLAYLHTHPADHEEGGHDDAIAFETRFPSAGRYRLYLQFKIDGRVHTAQFTRFVIR